jgi:hypothetical protein
MDLWDYLACWMGKYGFHSFQVFHQVFVDGIVGKQLVQIA